MYVEMQKKFWLVLPTAVINIDDLLVIFGDREVILEENLLQNKLFTSQCQKDNKLSLDG